MDEPVCLSLYFVNKQNVRSFGNILKSSLLKTKRETDDALFLQHIFEGELLASVISTEVRGILLNLKSNIRKSAKQDFRNYFSSIKKEEQALRFISKQDIFDNIWKALYEIIPKALYGGNQNTKIFRKLVQTVIYSSKKEHSVLGNLIGKWDLNVYPWNTLSIIPSKEILHKIILWLIKYLLSAMICLNFYVSTCKLDADEYKLYFFWKNQWQSFYDKKISNMIFTKIIRKHDTYCLGKKSRKKYSISERLKIKSVRKDIPKLHLVLKSNNDCRPIVRYKSESQTKLEKSKIKDRLFFLKTLTGKPQQKLELQFHKVYQQWINLQKPKLYFVKTDLSNAFGSINKEKLIKILCERHLNFQKMEKNVSLKKKIAQHYKDMMSELRHPLLVRAGSTVYEWMEGLVQGYKYSPALSELYYTHMDSIYFIEHLQKNENEIKLFIRVVDDYLYITNSLQDAHMFLCALSNYRNVNYEKTVVNFVHSSIQYSNEMTFLGYSYNTNTLEVSRAPNVYSGQMCYKIAFSTATSNISKFLKNRIGQSGIQINGHIFNLHYNSEETVWKHIFTTLCLSANKFCTILAIICEEQKMSHYLQLYKKRVAVKLCNSIKDTLMRHKPVDFLFLYCINHFRYLSMKALSLCAKQTPKCTGLVPLINDELAKTNCIFGKWREHASRIDTNGEIKRPAIREICRRTDLRKIMKNFDVLPKGFQCYNHKRLG